MITLSADGHVRLTLATLLDLRLIHLISGLDDENLPAPRQGATLSTISGYTEWVTQTKPVVTIGWDWSLDTLRGQELVREGEPRSNVMLLDCHGRDLGAEKTSLLLEAAVDSFQWQDVVQHTINERYSNGT